MQSLDVISINIWHILISLANLVIIFLIVKRFLFKPVKKLFAERRAAIDGKYAQADEAKAQALADKEAYESKLATADAQADGIIKDASDAAKRRAEQILADANARADAIVARAQEAAELERKKAEDDIKREIVGVSTSLAEKMLEREVNADDHRTLIDSFIDEIGEDNE